MHITITNAGSLVTTKTPVNTNSTIFTQELLPGVIPDTVSIKGLSSDSSFPFTLAEPFSLDNVRGSLDNAKGIIACVIKNGREFQGKLISVNDKRVELQSNDSTSVIIRDYDTIAYRKEIINRDSYVITFSLDNMIKESLQIRYITQSIYWSSVGTIELSEKEGGLLSIMAYIYFNGESIKSYVTLASGNISMPISSSMMLKSSQQLSDNSESLKSNYHFIDIGQLIITNGINAIPLKKFSLDSIDRYYIATSEAKETKYYLTFVTPEYIPKCNIIVFSKDSPGGGKDITLPIGSSSIFEKQVNDKVDVYLGSSSLVTADTNIERESTDNANEYIVSISCIINNRNSQISHVIFQYPIGDDTLIDTSYTGNEGNTEREEIKEKELNQGTCPNNDCGIDSEMEEKLNQMLLQDERESQKDNIIRKDNNIEFHLMISPSTKYDFKVKLMIRSKEKKG